MYPQVVQNLVKVLLSKLVMRGLLDSVLRGQWLTTILPDMLVLLGFSVLFFVIGIWCFKYE